MEPQNNNPTPEPPITPAADPTPDQPDNPAPDQPEPSEGQDPKPVETPENEPTPGDDPTNDGQPAADPNEPAPPTEGEPTDPSDEKHPGHEAWKARQDRRKQQTEIETANNALYQQDLDAAADIDDETKRTVMELQASQRRSIIDNNQRAIATEQMQAVRDFPLYQGEKGEKALATALRYFAPYLTFESVTDPSNGDIIQVLTGSKASLYQHLEQYAADHGQTVESSRQDGIKEGQKRVQKERNAAEPDFASGARGGSKDSRDDSQLTSAEYAKKHGLKHVSD